MKRRNEILLAVVLLTVTTTLLMAEDQPIAEINVHGNSIVSEEEILSAAGVTLETKFTDGLCEETQRRLLRTGKFAVVSVSKRYLSTTMDGPIALVIIVEEKGSLLGKFLFLPVISQGDNGKWNYGTMAGARDLLGTGERINLLATLGGKRLLAASLRYDFERFFFNSVTFNAGIGRETNSHYDLDEERSGFNLELAKFNGPWFYSVDVGRATSKFAALDDSYFDFALHGRFDTRDSIYFPGDSVYAGLDLEMYRFDGDTPDRNIYRLDLRAYKTFIGRSQIATQALYQKADGPLPLYMRPVLGGTQSLRGFDESEFSGDNLILGAVELRVPLSPASRQQSYGMHLFYNAGSVYEHATRLNDAEFYQGAGIGAYYFIFGAGFRLELVNDLEGKTRFQLGGGFSF